MISRHHLGETKRPNTDTDSTDTEDAHDTKLANSVESDLGEDRDRKEENLRYISKRGSQGSRSHQLTHNISDNIHRVIIFNDSGYPARETRVCTFGCSGSQLEAGTKDVERWRGYAHHY